MSSESKQLVNNSLKYFDIWNYVLTWPSFRWWDTVREKNVCSRERTGFLTFTWKSFNQTLEASEFISSKLHIYLEVMRNGYDFCFFPEFSHNMIGLGIKFLTELVQRWSSSNHKPSLRSDGQRCVVNHNNSSLDLHSRFRADNLFSFGLTTVEKELKSF